MQIIANSNPQPNDPLQKLALRKGSNQGQPKTASRKYPTGPKSKGSICRGRRPEAAMPKRQSDRQPHLQDSNRDCQYHRRALPWDSPIKGVANGRRSSRCIQQYGRVSSAIKWLRCKCTHQMSAESGPAWKMWDGQKNSNGQWLLSVREWIPITRTGSHAQKRQKDVQGRKTPTSSAQHCISLENI